MSDSTPSDRYKRFTVLIIDDQETVRTSVKLMLRALGFGTLLEAPDGEAAKKLFGLRPPDLILCDINMAPTNGFEFVQWLRKRGTGGIRVPVLFLTAHSEREVVMKAKTVGVDGFLVKPVRIADLTVRVDRAMRVFSR